MPFSPRRGGEAIRDPRDSKQSKGRMENPPRYMDKLGGLTGPSKAKKIALKVDKPVPGVRP